MRAGSYFGDTVLVSEILTVKWEAGKRVGGNVNVTIKGSAITTLSYLSGPLQYEYDESPWIIRMQNVVLALWVCQELGVGKDVGKYIAKILFGIIDLRRSAVTKKFFRGDYLHMKTYETVHVMGREPDNR